MFNNLKLKIMNNIIEISPIELQSIINAAQCEIAKHPTDYQIAKLKTQEIDKWLTSVIWDNPNEQDLIIMERPF